MSYVIVTFGSHECQAYPDLSHCTMGVAGPFETRTAAQAAFERLPVWTKPHIHPLERDPS